MIPKRRVCSETGCVIFESPKESKREKKLRNEIEELSDKYDKLESKLDKLIKEV